jgi:hypothetical protein
MTTPCPPQTPDAIGEPKNPSHRAATRREPTRSQRKRIATRDDYWTYPVAIRSVGIIAGTTTTTRPLPVSRAPFGRKEGWDQHTQGSTGKASQRLAPLLPDCCEPRREKFFMPGTVFLLATSPPCLYVYSPSPIPSWSSVEDALYTVHHDTYVLFLTSCGYCPQLALMIPYLRTVSFDQGFRTNERPTDHGVVSY